MPITRWNEESKTGRKGLPWLADWLETHPTDVGTTFQVTQITPSPQEHFILECSTESSDGFIVTAFTNSKAHEVIEKQFTEFKKDNVPLYVEVTNSDWGKWILAADTDKKCTWTKKGKGFTCGKAVTLTPPAQK